MTLWKYWALALVTGIWAVITWDYFAELPEGGLLDLAVTQAGVISALGALAAEGPHALEYHAWGTRTLDTVFPGLLGAFLLTGLVRYVTPVFLWSFGALVVLYVGVDYWENVLTLRLLAGGEAFSANAWASFLKYVFLCVPLGVVLLGLVRESYKAGRVQLGRMRRH